MGFTAGYKVNVGTQFEFTVSDETLAEVVQGGGITDGDLAEYCYTALYDSRVYKLFAAQGNYAWPDHTGADAANWAKTACPGILEGWDQPLTSAHPAFNKDLLDSTDQVYQRNFLVWEGTIYPGTENEKQGTFLVMDMVDIKRWYCNFDNAGFGTGNVTSAIGEEAPEGYVWPGYTGPTYRYYSNGSGQYPDILCDNNNPQLNPNTNLKVKNILIVNDEAWVGSLNPSTHGTSYMGGSGCSYAGRSLYGWYWNMNSNAGYLVANDGTCYQYGSLNFMGLPDYSNAPTCPGAPRDNIGSLTYACYAVCNNDNIIANLSGNWGQQNYATGVRFENNCHTTDAAVILKWQSWCGLKFQYNNTMYKPIIEGGIIVGYSDDMDAESEYDDMTNVTGNDIPSGPPEPPKPAPGRWDSIESSGTYSGALQFVRSYYVNATTLANLKTYMGKTEADGGPPNGYDMLESIIAIKMYPWALATSGSDSITISLTNPGGTWTELMRNNFIAEVASAITGTPYPGTEPPQVRIINTGETGHATDAAMRNYSLGTISMSQFTNSTYPFLTYDSTVELYLPFVGTFTLDPQTVMGATLSAYLNLDPATGGVYAYCYANKGGNNVMIAAGTGNIGVDIPISSAQAGVLQARVDAIRSQAAAGIVTTAASIADPIASAAYAGGAAGTAALAAGAAGTNLSADAFNMLSNNIHTNAMKQAIGNSIPQIASEAVATMSNSLTVRRQVKQLTQSHNMAMTGSVGSSVSEWSCPHTAYVKVMRPKEHNPGTNYPHAVGVPTYTSGTLSSYKGLTVCINADTTSISKATATERDAIASMLNGGVIV